MRFKISVLMAVVLLQTCASLAQTSEFRRFFQRSNGLPLLGATIYLVPQSNAYPTGALQCTADGARPGVYYRAAVPDGEYRVYINQGAGAMLYQQNLYLGESRLTSIANKFDGSNRLQTDGIKDGAVTGPKILDGTIAMADLAQSVKDYIDGAGGGTITNFPNEETITEDVNHYLGVKANSLAKPFLSDSVRNGLIVRVQDSTALKLCSPTVVGSQYVYLYEVAAGSGYGGGVFVRIQQTTALDKGRGVYTFPADAGYLWVRLEYIETPGVVRADWAGVKGDGADERLAVDRAVNSGGKTVRFGKAVINLGNAGAVSVPGGVNMKGEGMMQTIFLASRKYFVEDGNRFNYPTFVAAGDSITYEDFGVICSDSISAVWSSVDKKGIVYRRLYAYCRKGMGSFITSYRGRNYAEATIFYNYDGGNGFSIYQYNNNTFTGYDTLYSKNDSWRSGIYCYGGTTMGYAEILNPSFESHPLNWVAGGNCFNLYEGSNVIVNGGILKGRIAAATVVNPVGGRVKLSINGSTIKARDKLYSADFGLTRGVQDTVSFANCVITADTIIPGQQIHSVFGNCANSVISIENSSIEYFGTTPAMIISYADVDDTAHWRFNHVSLKNLGFGIWHNTSSTKVLLQAEYLNVSIPDSVSPTSSAALPLYVDGVKRGSYLRHCSFSTGHRNPNIHPAIYGLPFNFWGLGDSVMEVSFCDFVAPNCVLEGGGGSDRSAMYFRTNMKLSFCNVDFDTSKFAELWPISGVTITLDNCKVRTQAPAAVTSWGGALIARGSIFEPNIFGGTISLSMGRTFPVTIDPGSVSANTTSEQTFTVPGVQPGMRLTVSKPSHTAGLIIGNIRISAANTVAITFGNLSGSPIDPGSEVYDFTIQE